MHLHLITASVARAHGLKKYFTGRPCSSGHYSERSARTGKCYACEQEYRDRKSQRRAIAREADLVERRKSAVAVEHCERMTTRSEAKASGELYYFNGNPCKNGHIARRMTASGACVVCQRISASTETAKLKRKASIRAYYLKNRGKRLADGKAYREKNRHQFTQWMADWRKANPEKDRENRRASQSRRRAGGKGASPTEMKAWAAQQQKICHWCGARCEENYHVDHYEPLARGGRHEIANLVISCPPCNLRKSAKDPYDFAASLGRLF